MGQAERVLGRRGAFNSRALHPSRMAAMALLGIATVAGAPAAANDPGPVVREDTVKRDQLRPSVRSHAVAAFGTPKYGPGFQHFDYVNPDAPKGGVFSTAYAGSFDSLNPYILKGSPAMELGLIYDSLMTRSTDEPSSSYGLLAETIEIAPDRSSVTFTIRDEARWHDGMPVTADDVVWSYETLTAKGHPFFANNLADVKDVVALDSHTVRFELPVNSNRLIPLLIGDMPVLPKHYWEHVEVSFDSSSNVKPLGSGPYRLKDVDLGRTIAYERVADWWGKDLPVARGRYNFDEIRIEYFLDDTARFEAFKAQQFNFFRDTTAKRWAVEYDFPAMTDGRIRRENIDHNEPAGMQSFVFNTRREQFQDPRVREAIAQLFNYEWSNEMLAYGAYTRTGSYFENSPLASRGLPQGREREILEKYRGRVPDRLFTEEFRLPVYGHSREAHSQMRESMKRSMDLLKEAGYELRGGKMVHVQTGKKLAFEFLILSPAFERWIMPYKHTMERLGMTVNVRLVDSAQYINRFQKFDYDIVVAVMAQSNTPGAEQRNYWSSQAAMQPGSRNFAGVRDPVVDELVEMIVAADNEEELQAATRALDRVLLWNHYVVPHYHIRSYRVAYGAELDRPRQKVEMRLDLGEFDTWWSKRAGPQP